MSRKKRRISKEKWTKLFEEDKCPQCSNLLTEVGHHKKKALVCLARNSKGKRCKFGISIKKLNELKTLPKTETGTERKMELKKMFLPSDRKLEHVLHFSLEELIDLCGRNGFNLAFGGCWRAMKEYDFDEKNKKFLFKKADGKNPKEAVAKLLIALDKK